MSKRYATEFFRRESLRRKQPFTCLKNKTGGSVFVSAEKQDFEEIVRNRFGKAGMFVAQNNNTRAFGVCAEATSMRWQAWLKAALSERNQMRRHPL